MRLRFTLPTGILALASSLCAAGGDYLPLDGGRLYYEQCGAGPAIVLLHDGLVHSATWDGVWPALCRDFHAVRYDRRGFGRSDPPKAAFSPRDDLAALLRSLKMPRATLVGCSSGSGLAIDFAIEHPEMVERLILIGPVLHGMASSQHFDERGRRNDAPREKGDLKAVAENWSKDRYQIAGAHEEARKALYEALVANPQNLRYTGQWELRQRRPAVERISEIRVPTLILVGEGDIPDVHAFSGAIEAGIWGSRRDVIADAGHLVQMERPDVVGSAIADFIRRTAVADVPAAALERVAGQYRIFGGIGEFAVKEGRLALRLPAEKEYSLFPASALKYYMLAWGGIEFEFVTDASGAVTGVEMRRSSGVEHCERVKAPA